MCTVRRMWQLFDIIDDLITRSAKGDEQVRSLLNDFQLAVFAVFDGLQGPENWSGIALVYNDDLPDGVPEINDGFLHEMWEDRSREGGQ